MGTTRNDRDRRRDDEQFGVGIGVDGQPQVTWLGWTRSMRSAVNGVRPGTWSGALPVIVWLSLVVGITVGGRLLVGGDGVLWLIGALVVMVPVAAWWPRRRARNQVT
jgi:hypothetical protein